MSPGSGGGLKRNNSGYGIKIEKALSMSTLRRDFETVRIDERCGVTIT